MSEQNPKRRKLDLSDTYQMRPSRKNVPHKEQPPQQKPPKKTKRPKKNQEYYDPDYDDNETFNASNDFSAEAMANQQMKRKGSKIFVRIGIGFLVLAVLVGGGFIGYKKIMNNRERIARLEALYNEAQQSLERKEFDKAEEQFSEIADYKDAAQKLVEVMEARNQQLYDEAVKLEESKDFDGAREKFKTLADNAFKDAKDRLNKNDMLKKKDFVERLGRYLFDLNRNKELCFGVSDYVTDAWGRVRKAKVIPQALEEQKDNLERIQEKNKGLQKVYKKLQSEKIFSDNQGNYAMLNEYTKTATDFYLKIYRQVKEPTGRLNEYQKKMREYSLEFDVLYERMQDEESQLRTVFQALVEEERLRLLDEQKSIVTGKSVSDDTNKDKKKEETPAEKPAGKPEEKPAE